MDEPNRLKARYSAQIEDGRKIEVFTSMPEWQWYVDSVINPTVQEYIQRIMAGEIATDKEDWIIRGMVMGMKLVIESTEGFKRQADDAKKKAKLLQEALDEDSQN